MITNRLVQVEHNIEFLIKIYYKLKWIELIQIIKCDFVNIPENLKCVLTEFTTFLCKKFDVFVI